MIQNILRIRKHGVNLTERVIKITWTSITNCIFNVTFPMQYFTIDYCFRAYSNLLHTRAHKWQQGSVTKIRARVKKPKRGSSRVRGCLLKFKPLIVLRIFSAFQPNVSLRKPSVFILAMEKLIYIIDNVYYCRLCERKNRYYRYVETYIRI